MLRVVLDTNVVVAGLRSSSGASYLLLAALRARRFIAAVSNPLCLEYLDVLSRPDLVPVLAAEGAEAWLDGFLVLCQCCHVSFLFRPTLADADDDRIMEAALAAPGQLHRHPQRHRFCGCRRPWHHPGDTGRFSGYAAVTMSALHVTIAEPLSEQIRQFAAEGGLTAERFVEAILERQISADEDFRQLKARAARGRIEDFDRVMAAVPDVPPMPGDELSPEELAYWRASLAQGRPPPASSDL